jgi:hypothetical protein
MCVYIFNVFIFRTNKTVFGVRDFQETAGPKDGVITLQNPHNTAHFKKKFPKVSPKFLEHCASSITTV